MIWVISVVAFMVENGVTISGTTTVSPGSNAFPALKNPEPPKSLGEIMLPLDFIR